MSVATTSTEYSVRDVARIFGLQEARLRYWSQTGFVGPTLRRNGRFYYTFEDLIGVKVAKELLDKGLPLQRVRKNLEALRSALPQIERPLSQLRVCSDGDKVVVVTDEATFEPATGQLRLSFEVASLGAEIAEILRLPAPGAVADNVDIPAAAETAATPESAYTIFQEALRAEDEGDTERAETLCRRALARCDSFAAAWTNLGNLCEARGARGEAREAYEKALALDPEQPEARYNLANVLADVGEIDLALAECRRVTTSCPEFADAHYNLALLYLRVGSLAQARTHLVRYLELDPESEWADRARELSQSLG